MNKKYQKWLYAGAAVVVVGVVIIATQGRGTPLQGNINPDFDYQIERGQLAQEIVLLTEGINEDKLPANESVGCAPDLAVGSIYHGYEKSSCFLVYHKVMNLFPDGNFRPGDKVNRAGAAVIVTKAMVSLSKWDKGLKQLFSDVPLNTYFISAVNTLALQGISDTINNPPCSDPTNVHTCIGFLPGTFLTLARASQWMSNATSHGNGRPSAAVCYNMYTMQHSGLDLSGWMDNNGYTFIDSEYCKDMVIGESQWYGLSPAKPGFTPKLVPSKPSISPVKSSSSAAVTDTLRKK